MNRLHLFSLLFIACLQGAIVNCSDVISRDKKDIKILVLNIASDDYPVYMELEKLWRSYMHYDPEHVECYFIRGNPNLLTDYEILGDTIWSKTSESFVPGILNKTILSMEAMLPRMKEFDYVVRTNLSTFFIFPRLLKFLETAPKSNFYNGVIGTRYSWVSGGAIVMSTDIAELFIKNKEFFIGNTSTADDLVMAFFITSKKINFTSHERADFYSIGMWNANKNNISDTVFDFRIKNTYHHLRLSEDVFIYSELLKMFY